MTRNYKQIEVYDYATQWKGLIFNNSYQHTSPSVCLCVCVSTPAQRKVYQSHYTLVKEIIPVLKSHAVIPVEIPVIIPVTPAVDVYAL